MYPYYQQNQVFTQSYSPNNNQANQHNFPLAASNGQQYNGYNGYNPLTQSNDNLPRAPAQFHNQAFCPNPLPANHGPPYGSPVNSIVQQQQQHTYNIYQPSPPNQQPQPPQPYDIRQSSPTNYQSQSPHNIYQPSPPNVNQYQFHGNYQPPPQNINQQQQQNYGNYQPLPNAGYQQPPPPPPYGNRQSPPPNINQPQPPYNIYQQPPPNVYQPQQHVTYQSPKYYHHHHQQRPTLPTCYINLTQEEIDDRETVKRIINVNEDKANSLFWPRDLLSRIKGADFFKIYYMVADGAWDYGLFATLYFKEEEGEYDSKKEEERHESLRIFVAAFTVKIIKMSKESDSNDILYQFDRELLNTFPVRLSPISGVSRIRFAQPLCGQTSKHTEIARIGVPPSLKSTKVHVVYTDVASAIKAVVGNAAPSRKKVVVLNMTDPKKPGGDWKVGDASHEASLFVQTTLSDGLKDDDYPLEDFTCLYTQGAKLIRDGDAKGYKFIPDFADMPFDVISVAGVDASTNGGKNSHNAFTRAEAAVVRVKIELMFNVCAQKGANVLILGAIGCGKFENPPKSVAGAFRSVIELYAGYFDEIYFVIYDEETVNVFAQVLTSNAYEFHDNDDDDEQAINDCPTYDYKRNFATLPMPTDVRLKVCEDGGLCESTDTDHHRTHSHPPFCPYGDGCPYSSSTLLGMADHNLYFMHKVMCPYMGECTMFEDKAHCEHFFHPDRCSKWENCRETNKTHTKNYLHPPMCDKGLLCDKMDDSQHKALFRHAEMECPYGHTCRLIHEKRHMESYSHPFLKPCEDSPFNCTDRSPEHMSERSHLCEYGPNCAEINNPDHTWKYYHAGYALRDPASLRDIPEERLQELYCPLDYLGREQCPAPLCTNQSAGHKASFYHKPHKAEFAQADMLNCRDLGDPDSYGDYAKTSASRIPFFKNTHGLIKKLDKYINGNLDTQCRNYKEIREWVRQFRPVCVRSADDVIAILNIGAIYSNKRVGTLWEDPEDIVSCAFRRRAVLELVEGDLNNEKEKCLRKYGKRYACFFESVIAKPKIKDTSNLNLEGGGGFYQRTPQEKGDEKLERDKSRASCVQLFGEDAIEMFEDAIKNVVTSLSVSIDAMSKPDTTEDMARANYTVPAIIGPNYSDNGNSDVAIVLRKTTMWHPDFYMLPSSLMSYFDGTYRKVREPWMEKALPAAGGGSKHCFEEKLSLVDPQVEDALAKDLICRAQVAENMALTDMSRVSLEDVKECLRRSDPSNHIEGRLPQLIPLDYLEHMIIRKSAYDRILENPIAMEQLENLKRRFGDDFVELVEEADDVKSANEEYLSRTVPINCPLGYTFSIIGKREQFIPLNFKRDERKIYIYFMAYGSKFSVSVSDIGDLKNGDVRRQVATFEIDGSAMAAYAHYMSPTSVIGLKRANKELEFNRGCPTSGYVHYLLCVDHDSSLMTFKHWGASTCFNNKELTLEIPSGVTYSYLSFASSARVEERPCIWNLNVEYRERPKVAEDLPTEDEVQAEQSKKKSPNN